MILPDNVELFTDSEQLPHRRIAPPPSDAVLFVKSQFVIVVLLDSDRRTAPPDVASFFSKLTSVSSVEELRDTWTAPPADPPLFPT